MEIRLHVQRWNKDKPAENEWETTALCNGVLELNGTLIRNGEVKVTTEGGGILVVNADLLPTALEVVVHDPESWEEILAREL
jgi:hypothetical protein